MNEESAKSWVYTHSDGSETRVSDAAGYEDLGWVHNPQVPGNTVDPTDAFYTGCADECEKDCMADHRGES